MTRHGNIYPPRYFIEKLSLNIFTFWLFGTWVFLYTTSWMDERTWQCPAILVLGETQHHHSFPDQLNSFFIRIYYSELQIAHTVRMVHWGNFCLILTYSMHKIYWLPVSQQLAIANWNFLLPSETLNRWQLLFKSFMLTAQHGSRSCILCQNTTRGQISWTVYIVSS